jgi:hypothetical protein
MAGEAPILVQTFDNVGLANPNPYSVMELDVSNSDAVRTSAKLPTAADSECIGVLYDRAKLDTNGNVVANSGFALRMQGIARCVAASAITAGDFVAVQDNTGRISTQAKATAGNLLIPIVGRALTTCANANETVLVLLMIGARV